MAVAVQYTADLPQPVVARRAPGRPMDQRRHRPQLVGPQVGAVAGKGADDRVGDPQLVTGQGGWVRGGGVASGDMGPRYGEGRTSSVPMDPGASDLWTTESVVHRLADLGR